MTELKCTCYERRVTGIYPQMCFNCRAAKYEIVFYNPILIADSNSMSVIRTEREYQGSVLD